MTDDPRAEPISSITLLVEGRLDEQLVRDIVQAAGFPQERLAIRVVGGKYAMGAAIQAIPADRLREHAALVDLDESSVPDAIHRAREQLADPPIDVFCCVPRIEAWLFADDALALRFCARDDEALGILRRIPPPEEIPDPRELARRLFGPPSSWSFLREMDVQRAAARSPSLRAFLVGLGGKLGVRVQAVEDSVGRNVSRAVIASLLAEILPADTVVWRTADGEAFTAAELRRHIERGSPLGQQYTSDLLRISRDFLRRAAARRTAT